MRCSWVRFQECLDDQIECVQVKVELEMKVVVDLVHLWFLVLWWF